MIYPSLHHAIMDIYDNNIHIKSRRPVSGGDVNEAWRLELDDGTILFMKSNRPGFLANFEAEAAGLDAIRNTNTIGTPRVLGIGKEKNNSFLLLEYIGNEKRVNSLCG